jgi:hypothetical protein
MQAEQSADAPEDFAQRGIRYSQEQWTEIIGQTEDFVRANPTRALCYGVAAGFLLDRLPIFRLLGGILRLTLKAFKPAVLIYGATKLYQMVQNQD